MYGVIAESLQGKMASGKETEKGKKKYRGKERVKVQELRSSIMLKIYKKENAR